MGSWHDCVWSRVSPRGTPIKQGRGIREKFWKDPLRPSLFGQDGWILAKFFFFFFFFFACLWDRDGAEVRKFARKKRGQYPATLTEQAWSGVHLRGNFSCGTRRVFPSGQDSSILRTRVANLARTRSYVSVAWIFFSPEAMVQKQQIISCLIWFGSIS